MSSITKPAPSNSEQTPSLSEFAALIVDEVDENEFLRSVAQRDTKSLPVRLLQLPLEASDLSRTAVLSWRWDTQEAQPSNNLISAIRQAKRMGIQYLFIDFISIDQQLQGDALLEHVISFSTLFKTVPVIATYDKGGDDFMKTVRRPWIQHEIRTFRYNPTRVVYVSHSTNQGAEWESGLPFNESLVVPVDLWRYEFGQRIDRVWRSGFTLSILGVLCGEVGMSVISDFKFVMPAYAKVFTVAFDQMSPNDYLLTAALLCQVYSKEGLVNDSTNIRAVNFDRYTFGDTSYTSRKVSETDIFLDGNKVAVWRQYYNEHTTTLRYYLKTDPEAERVILEALGPSAPSYEEYAAQDEIRRASRFIDQTVPLPKIDLVSINLELATAKDLYLWETS